MALLLTLGAGQAEAAESLVKLLRDASRGGSYVQPDAREVAEAEALFQRCFRQCDGEAVRQGWAQLGFEMLQIQEGGKPLSVIREKEHARQGRGFYVFSPTSASQTVLQAPHSFKDENTREILLHLLAEGDFRAAAWNTVPRHYVLNGRRVDADMAHLSGTYFLAFSRTFARQMATGKLVQLHGFAQEKRRSGSGANAEIVLSSGARDPGAMIHEMGACLRQAGIGDVRIYPSEIRELGATTNSTGQALRDLGHRGFVHIEMSAATRQLFLNEKSKRTRLLRCLEK